MMQKSRPLIGGWVTNNPNQRNIYHLTLLCSYNVGCTKRVGLFPNRKTTLENERKQRILNGNIKNYLLEYKKVRR